MATPEQRTHRPWANRRLRSPNSSAASPGRSKGRPRHGSIVNRSTDQLTRVRDGAAEMLESLTSGAETGSTAPRPRPCAPSPKMSRQTASKAITAVGAGRRAGKAQRK